MNQTMADAFRGATKKQLLISFYVNGRPIL